MEERWTTVRGLRIHSWASSGRAGAPVVLAHGLVISGLYMLPLAKALAGEYSVHVLDLPGFGASEGPAHALDMPELADFILEWMTAVGMDRSHVVANSMGCQVVAHCAVKAPARVETLSLIGPTIDPAAHHVHSQLVHLLRDAIQEPPRLWVKWARDFFRSGLRRALETTRAMFQDYIERQLPRVECRTLVIRGEKDPTMPQAWGEQAAALLRQSHLEVIRGAPHCAHFTNPELVAALVTDHIAGKHAGAAGKGRASRRDQEIRTAVP